MEVQDIARRIGYEAVSLLPFGMEASVHRAHMNNLNRVLAEPLEQPDDAEQDERDSKIKRLFKDYGQSMVGSGVFDTVSCFTGYEVVQNHICQGRPLLGSLELIGLLAARAWCNRLVRAYESD